MDEKATIMVDEKHLEMNEKQQGTALKTDYKTRRGWFLRGAVTPLRTKSLKTATNCIFNLFSILVYNRLLHSTFIAKTQPKKWNYVSKENILMWRWHPCADAADSLNLYILCSLLLTACHSDMLLLQSSLSLDLLVWSTMQWPMQSTYYAVCF